MRMLEKRDQRLRDQNATIMTRNGELEDMVRLPWPLHHAECSPRVVEIVGNVAAGPCAGRAVANELERSDRQAQVRYRVVPAAYSSGASHLQCVRSCHLLALTWRHCLPSAGSQCQGGNHHHPNGADGCGAACIHVQGPPTPPNAVAAHGTLTRPLRASERGGGVVVACCTERRR